MMPDGSREKSVEVLILGAGLTGLSAACHLDREYMVAEAASSPGGTAGTLYHGDFRLDRGVHVLYFRDPWTRKWISDETGIPLTRNIRRSAVWLHGRMIPYPVQFNLAETSFHDRWRYGLSALAASASSGRSVSGSNLKQWARSNFGRLLTENFLLPYNKKLWGVDPDQLNTEWMDGYVPRPSFRRILSGWLSSRDKGYGANAVFWYPETGGIANLSSALSEKAGNIEYGARLVNLDIQSHSAKFDNGLNIKYHQLISTIPLTDLVESVDKASESELPYFETLRSHSTTILHILLHRSGIGENLHWVYTADINIPFYRITLPHNICSSNCPPGWSALTLEIGGEIDDKAWFERKCKKALIEMGLMRESESRSSVVWDRIKHGYVIYDCLRAETTRRIISILRGNDVICLGRYGRWEYSNMESALLQGRQIRRRLESPLVKTNPLPDQDGRPEMIPVQKYFLKSYSKRSRGLTSVFFRRGESDRLKYTRRWIPQCEGLDILDTGCGDGTFLAQILNGYPRYIRLEDCVADNSTRAYQKLENRADQVEAVAVDTALVKDSRQYDVVFALGILDYEPDWPGLIRSLLARSRGFTILDFPKAGTFHALIRRLWLGLHQVKLQTGSRSSLNTILAKNHGDVEIIDLPLHWLLRIGATGE
jgi:protoporphyrinogen oxidase